MSARPDNDKSSAYTAVADHVANTLLQNPYGSNDILVPLPFFETALESVFGTLAYLYVLEQRTQLAHSTNILSILMIVFALYIVLYLATQFAQANNTGSVARMTVLLWFFTRVVNITTAALGLLVFGVISGWLIDGPHASSFAYVNLLFPFIVCVLLFMFLVFVKQVCQTNPAIIRELDIQIHNIALQRQQ